MDIGPEQPPFIAEPLEDPFRRSAPAPPPAEPDPEPDPEPVRETQDAPAGA